MYINFQPKPGKLAVRLSATRPQSYSRFLWKTFKLLIFLVFMSQPGRGNLNKTSEREFGYCKVARKPWHLNWLVHISPDRVAEPRQFFTPTQGVFICPVKSIT